ncbi:MAG: histidine phosphatase family protein [Actinomycetota bacterium]
MELILVRHGRPEHIVDADGPADPPLTDVGHRQARAAAGWLSAESIDAIYVSPMVRARETAAPLERLLGMEATVHRGVREFDAEESSYIPVEIMRQDKATWEKFLSEESATNYQPFYDEVIDALVEIAGANRSRRVAVVCHGGVINMWASRTLGLGPSMFFQPEYTSINRFAVSSRGHESILSLNEVSHLRGAPDLRVDAVMTPAPEAG